MHTPQILIRTLVAAALLSSAATAGLAAGKEATFGSGKASGPFLTKAQLRDCMNQQTKVKQQDTDLQAQQDKLNADKAEIGKRGDTLKTQLEALDRTNPEAVNAYNEQAAARDKMIDDYQDQVNQFNTRVQAFNTERESFTKNCSNRRYFEDDEIAIRKGK
ncbi:MAG TPA: hypothetical protein VJO99_23825 [Burkholderiaceae bacterium]|nr:hypothetical protein [Burkholderiaceae bacterium]